MPGKLAQYRRFNNLPIFWDDDEFAATNIFFSSLSTSEPNSQFTLFWDNINFFSYDLTRFFFIVLGGSLIYCVFLILLRWNLFGGRTTQWIFFSKFPVQAVALFYSFVIFLLSLFLCLTQFHDLVYTGNTVEDAIVGLLTERWFPQADYNFSCNLNVLGTLDVTDSLWIVYDWVVSSLLLFSEWPMLRWCHVDGERTGVHAYFNHQYFWWTPRFYWGDFEETECVNGYPNLAGELIVRDVWLWTPTLHFIQNTLAFTQLGRFQYGLFSANFVIPFFRNAMEFSFSFDGLSLIFICLTAFVTFLCICISWYSYRRDFHYTLIILLLITQFLIVIAFSTLDLILFYIAFESVLIPLFFLVGIFGSRERRIKAAYYLMFYTLFGSVPFLIGLLYIWYKTGQTNLLLLEPFLYGSFSQQELTLLWFLFLPGFAFKIPLYPFHLWLPEAHVEAPTVGSVILAGLVLKLGGYGFIRFSIGLLYWGGITYLNIIYWFCLFSMLCAILCAACQIDLKRIIAYGSISHMALVTLCIFLGTQAGLESAMIMMLGHGFVSSALFILVGGLYERYHSRNVRYYGGLYRTLPKFGTFFFLFILFDIGVPGSPSFVAELLAFISLTQQSIMLAFFMAIPTIIGAGVSLLLCSRVLFGLNERRYYTSFQTLVTNFSYWVRFQKLNSLQTSGASVTQSIVVEEHIIAKNFDFLQNEIFVLGCLFSAALLLGVWPQSFLQWFTVDLENLLMTVSLL